MKIGTVKLNNNTVFAPLAGITNLPLRLMAKAQGCGLVCSEMISSNGLIYNSEKTLKMLKTLPEEQPLSIQIFGVDPSIMAEAAKIVESSGAAIIDINFGCSVRKILKSGSGSALMKDLQKSEALLKAVRKAVNIPLTIKIRSGWDKSGEQALRLSQIAQDCGVDAVAVHPRTASQGFRGQSDWSIIAAVKKQIKIPVIGNGDITRPEDAARMIEETACDAVMVGRAAIGNPLIFSQIIALLNGEEIVPFDLNQHFKLMIQYLEDSVKYIGEEHACKMMRSRLSWFVKGLPRSSKFRESIKHITTEKEAKTLIQDYLVSLKEHF